MKPQRDRSSKPKRESALRETLAELISREVKDPRVHAAGIISVNLILTLTRSLARYWAKHNITVNAIAPGIFPSNATKGLEKKIDIMEAAIPMGRLGYTDDFKGAAVFLASPAADYITGQVLVVDGGMLA